MGLFRIGDVVHVRSDIVVDSMYRSVNIDGDFNEGFVA